MKAYQIEIDEHIWSHLQNHAEPFVDTPNTVLHRLLGLPAEATAKTVEADPPPAVRIKGIPKSLAQILEVLYEIEVNGYSRIEATNRVAEKRGTAPQTVTDKYCRQLNQRANEIDLMFSEPGYHSFREILMDKFPAHRGIIDTYIESILDMSKNVDSTRC